MNPESLQTSFWIMVVVQTIGSVDMPGSGARKMPSPRQYVAIVATWLVLMLIAGASEGAERATRIIGWVLVLVGMVVGPFGVRTIGLFNNIAANFRTAPSTPTQGVQAAGQGVAAGVQSAATNQG